MSDIEIFHETFDNNATFLPLNNVEEARKILLVDKNNEINNDFKIPFQVMEERIKELFK